MILNSSAIIFLKKVAKYLDRTRMFLVLFYQMNVGTKKGVKDNVYAIRTIYCKGCVFRS